ncbi:hypothetical protein QR680_005006 [Steinernema hermaphroditum]|uniref:Uncharacterized protein n=1 Tax=Steinernema hermaphroditum TaxID=289476 RepID=A0AA39LU42_9BILA|nr:hypothetical protein QR680_005006 [Steinernema hermaphroditum]
MSHRVDASFYFDSRLWSPEGCTNGLILEANILSRRAREEHVPRAPSQQPRGEVFAKLVHRQEMASYRSPRFVDNSDDIKTFNLDKYTRLVSGKRAHSIDESAAKNGRHLEAKISLSRGILRLLHRQTTLEEVALVADTVSVKSRDRRLVFACTNDSQRAFRIRFATVVEHCLFCDVASRFVTISDEVCRTYIEASRLKFPLLAVVATSLIPKTKSSFWTPLFANSYGIKNFNLDNSTQQSLFSSSSGSQPSQDFPNDRRRSILHSSQDSFVESEPTRSTPTQRSSLFSSSSGSQPSQDLPTNRRSSAQEKREPQELEVIKIVEKPATCAAKTLKERREEHRRTWKGPGMQFPAAREPTPTPGSGTSTFRAPRLSILEDRPQQFSLGSESIEDRSALFRAFQYIRMDPTFDELLNIVRQFDDFEARQRFVGMT